MSSIHTTKWLQQELVKRGLVPDNCRLLEVRIEAGIAPLILRYEVFVDTQRVALFAEALQAAADAQLEDDERNRIAVAKK